MSLFPIGADKCLIKTVNRTSTSANKVCLIEGNSKHKKCMAEGFVSLSWVVWLHEKMVSWPRFQGHKTIFSCNMHIFFNMFSQQLPPSFCVSFKHYPAADLGCSTLVKMQQSLIASVKLSCRDAFPLSQKQLILWWLQKFPVTVAFSQLRCKKSSFFF